LPGHSALNSALRFAALAGLSVLLAGCLRPLYARNTVASSSGSELTTGITEQLASVSVEPIDGRVGQKLRNDLIFRFYGGGSPGPARYNLRINVRNTPIAAAVVDPFTKRAEVNPVGIDVAYTLVQIDTGREVTVGYAFGRASYTKTSQRFAAVRARRDAQDHAAEVAAQQIFIKIASAFASGVTEAPRPPTTDTAQNALQSPDTITPELKENGDGDEASETSLIR